MTRLIARLFRNPDAYRIDPGGYARNQIGHFLVIGALPVWLGFPLWVVVVIYALFEWAQWRFAEAEPSDGLEDFAFVLMGALSVDDLMITAPAVSFLAAGYLFRKGY
ncbi:hypothetical protein [uncultured Roseobacter sp.]|uniref:hypothetical protein n=1 Tax=uncultured Roseobacter sp. TaxID=114847 RepID=UPI00260A150A|nr:hypothetical protein [uncultured Roseobacter sp.]